jgi:hypothetical protein
MAKNIIITLADIEIVKWTVNIAEQNVLVKYAIKTDTGDLYAYGEAVFWAALPNEDNPGNWYQLPEEYVTTLSNLTSDARLALLHLVNE